MNNYCESFEITTTTKNQEVIPAKFKNGDRSLSPSIKNLTLAVSQDTAIYINWNTTPVIVKAKYGLQLPSNLMSIKSIVVEESGIEIYAVYSY